MRYDRVIRVACLDFNSRQHDSNNLRVYWPKGIAATVHTGSGWTTPLLMIVRDE